MKIKTITYRGVTIVIYFRRVVYMATAYVKPCDAVEIRARFGSLSEAIEYAKDVVDCILKYR